MILQLAFLYTPSMCVGVKLFGYTRICESFLVRGWTVYLALLLAFFVHSNVVLLFVPDSVDQIH